MDWDVGDNDHNPSILKKRMVRVIVCSGVAKTTLLHFSRREGLSSQLGIVVRMANASCKCAYTNGHLRTT